MSKGLEALEKIYNNLINDIEQEVDEFYNASDDIKYWEEKYNCVKKELQVLEIIKKKMVNVYQIWVYDDYEKYKHYYPFGEYHAIEGMLTLEEFELIKGVVLK